MSQKNISKFLITGLVTANLLLAYPFSVRADYAGEQPQTRNFSIDKKVLDPRSNKFVDNLTVDQFKFLPNQDVWFRVEIKNNTSAELVNVVGKDVLPASMQLVSGDGVYDPASNTLTVTIDRIAPNSSRFWDIKASFVSGKGGVSMSTACANNYAEARKDNDVVSDTANVCVSDKVLGEVSELPRTGPAATAILLGSLFSSLTGGYLVLRKKAV